jgi:hypothetical protein
MAARVRPDTGKAMAKRQRVTNWSAYDGSLVNRSKLTIWFDDASIKDNWTPAPPVGRGKPEPYLASSPWGESSGRNICDKPRPENSAKSSAWTGCRKAAPCAKKSICWPRRVTPPPRCGIWRSSGRKASQKKRVSCMSMLVSCVSRKARVNPGVVRSSIASPNRRTRRPATSRPCACCTGCWTPQRTKSQP